MKQKILFKLLITILLWVLLQGLHAQNRAENSPEYLGGARNWPPRALSSHPEGVHQAWFTGFGKDSSQVIRTQPVMVSEIPSNFSRPNLLLHAAFCDTTWVFTDWSDDEYIYTHQLEPFSFLWVCDSELGDMAYIYSPRKGNYLHHYVPIEYIQWLGNDTYTFQLWSPVHEAVVIIYADPEGFEVNFHLNNSGLHVTQTYAVPPIHHKTREAANSSRED